jgi:hypothetical protein
MRQAAAVILALLLLAVAARCPAAAWRFEAETVDALHGHDVGGSALQVVSCSAASGGLALEGLDTPGDWVAFDFALAAQTCLIDSLRCAGPTGESWQFLVEFYSQGSSSRVARIDHASIAGRGVT